MLSRETKRSPYFHAVACRFSQRDGALLLPSDFAEVLGASVGDTLAVLPLP